MKKNNKLIDRVVQQDTINFWLTNRIPRTALTLFMGWFSRIEQPLVARVSMALWRFFADDLQLHEAKKTRFSSMHDCFIRELKDGVRPVTADPDVVVSPCDAIVVTLGRVHGNELIQAKGMTYTLEELLADPEQVERFHDGFYVTLRLKSNMYHRFHAPCDCRVRRVDYISGDVWNVNPVALRRIERLYCKNERAVIPLDTDAFGAALTLVPVAAILVASIHLNFLNVLLNLKYRGPNRIDCDAGFRKGEEMGYFQHGSTIIVLARAPLQPCEGLEAGMSIRTGEPLLRCTQT